MKKSRVITITEEELKETLSEVIDPLFEEIRELKAKIDLLVNNQGGPRKKEKYAGANADPDKAIFRAQLWKSIVSKQDARVHRQRAAGKIP